VQISAVTDHRAKSWTKLTPKNNGAEGGRGNRSNNVRTKLEDSTLRMHFQQGRVRIWLALNSGFHCEADRGSGMRMKLLATKSIESRESHGVPKLSKKMYEPFDDRRPVCHDNSQAAASRFRPLAASRFAGIVAGDRCQNRICRRIHPCERGGSPRRRT
jgi:hypothetical protein